MTNTTETTRPAPGLDFTGAKIANHRPGARVRTWTGETGTVLGLGGSRRGMVPLEDRVYEILIDGETVRHGWAAWMVTAAV